MMPDGCKGGYGEKHIVVYLLNKTKTTSATPKNLGWQKPLAHSLVGPDSIFRIESGASLNIILCFQCFDLRGHGMLISINTPTSQ